jgi:hypothetical protein
MSNVLNDFYKGNSSLDDLTSELEFFQRTVENYQGNDVYIGDQYYQEALQTKKAIEEAINNFYEYYNEDGSFKTSL